MRVLTTLFAALVTFAAPAQALDVKASTIDLTWHIENPKKFDGHLSAGGGKAVLHVDPADIAKTGLDLTMKAELWTSDNEMRDSATMETIEAFVYPTITWKVQGVKGPEGPFKPGKYDVSATGALSFHGVTHEMKTFVEVEVGADGTITATSEFQFSLEKFKIVRPKAPVIGIPIDDVLPVKVKLVFPAGAALFAAPAPAPTPLVPVVPATP